LSVGKKTIRYRPDGQGLGRKWGDLVTSRYGTWKGRNIRLVTNGTVDRTDIPLTQGEQKPQDVKMLKMPFKKRESFAQGIQEVL
jgi:hypothetical protein